MKNDKVQNVFKNEDKEKRKKIFNYLLAEAINRAEKYHFSKKI